MSIYPCNFNEAWEPLIAPTKPSNYNKQSNEIKKIMQDTTNYSTLTNQVLKPDIETNEKYIKGGNYMNNNYNKIESMNNHQLNNMSNVELMNHITNLEKYMKDILYTLKMNKIEQLDNEYYNKNKFNEMAIYILITIIVSYIVFKFINK